MKKTLVILMVSLALTLFLKIPATAQTAANNGAEKTLVEKIKFERDGARHKACIANMKTIAGACELYAMEQPSLDKVTLKALVAEKYLKMIPKCADVEGNDYQIIIAAQKDGSPVDVVCAYHGSLNNPSSISSEKQSKINKELIKSVQSNDTSKAKMLIESSADTNFKTSSGTTALHYAAFNGNIEIINLLIKNGADVKARAKDGVTPLHYAASKNYKDAVKILIEKGADINAKDVKGKTPLNYSKNNEIINLLKNMN